MAITDSLVLADDVILTPVADLPPPLREQVPHDDGDYAITRPRSRTPSSIIDAQAATLLELFREPSTVVEAVLTFSRSQNADPNETLEDAYPLIQRLLHARLLVPAGSEEAGHIEARFQSGDSVAGWDVIHCVQVLEDTELYQVRREDGGEAALKILRPHAGALVRRTLHREAAILRHLDGSVSPRLMDTGAWEETDYLVMEWCPGVPAEAAAYRLRGQSPAGLRRLCSSILTAYAELHRRGVVHADIHPRNVLVTDDGAVKIIDFGWARLAESPGDLGRAERAGVGFFYEPEMARAQRAHAHPPAASFAGEQYALGALLYLLLTGAHYVDFSVEKHEMLRQIAEDGPRPFAAHGMTPWPAGEALLARALSKDLSGRFLTVADWAAQWADACPDDTTPDTSGGSPVPEIDLKPAMDVLDQVLARVGLDGPLLASGLPQAPFCSVNNGAAGIAYALYRLAMARDDAALLSGADVWATRALRGSARDDAFENPALELTSEVIGAVTPYHTLSGVHVVRSLIGHAMGDFVTAQNALAAFLAAARTPCANPDVTLGRSGVLLACTLLREALPDNPFLELSALEQMGTEILAGIWAEVETYAPIPDGTEVTFLGIAHGWAGLLYAALRWCHVTGAALPASVAARLGELADLAEPVGPGARWKRTLGSGSRDYWSGWCNGSAGFVHLWTLAHRVFGESAYGRLAEQAARHSWDAAEPIGDLCCGLSGRAYAMLALYKHTGETIWRHRAQSLGAQAGKHIASALLRDSLYKGETGVALLAADLVNPEAAAMPFFEGEGWAARNISR